MREQNEEESSSFCRLVDVASAWQYLNPNLSLQSIVSRRLLICIFYRNGRVQLLFVRTISKRVSSFVNNNDDDDGIEQQANEQC
jgi:hypothetical protein